MSVVVGMVHWRSGQQEYCSFDSVPGEALGAERRKGVGGNGTEAWGTKGRKQKEDVRGFVLRRKCVQLKQLPLLAVRPAS